MQNNQKNKSGYRIFITGGHLTPALAVMDAIRTSHPNWQIYFVGRRYAMEKDRMVSEEFRIVRLRKVPFLPLTAGRLMPILNLNTIISFLKIPVGFIQAGSYLRKYKPDLIMSFGGYIGLPVALMGKAAGVPVVIHEQTVKPGLANVISAKIATAICLGSDQSVGFFPRNKTHITGLPIRIDLFGKFGRPDFIPQSQLPMIYITGGATGAKSLNNLIYGNLDYLLAKFQVVHQVGRNSLVEATDIKTNLPVEFRDRYLVISYADLPEHAWLMQNSVFNISRSGANTVGETMALAKPALFIPLPWSRNNEQFLNAKIIADQHACGLIHQDQLDASGFRRELEKFIATLPEIKTNIQKLSEKYPHDAASAVVRILENILNG